MFKIWRPVACGCGLHPGDEVEAVRPVVAVTGRVEGRRRVVLGGRM